MSDAPVNPCGSRKVNPGGEPVTVTMDPKTYSDLGAVLVWAALYDRERNNGKNKEIYERVLPACGVRPA